MYTEEQLKEFQDQVPEEFKYFFKNYFNKTDYSEFIKDGKPDLDIIRRIHSELLEEYHFYLISLARFTPSGPTEDYQYYELFCAAHKEGLLDKEFF